MLGVVLNGDVDCFCMFVNVLICCRRGCVVFIASCRLMHIELSIQCCKGGCNTAMRGGSGPVAIW